MTTAQRITMGCLAALGLSLILVGIVSDTNLRHAVQIVPIAAAASLAVRHPAWGAYASIPIFGFWTFIVTLIWLFLAGVSRIANGTYTPIEIASTVVMAGCSLVGIGAALRAGKPLTWPQRTLASVGFLLLQIAAMWLSFRPGITNR